MRAALLAQLGPRCTVYHPEYAPASANLATPRESSHRRVFLRRIRSQVIARRNRFFQFRGIHGDRRKYIAGASTSTYYTEMSGWRMSYLKKSEELTVLEGKRSDTRSPTFVSARSGSTS